LKLSRLLYKFTLCIFSGFLVFSADLSAKELRWTHFGVRPLAMGNAYVAVADDYNALFYNPAGLARLKEWDGELFNFHAELSQNTSTFIKDAQDLFSGSAGDTEAVLNLIEDNAGKVQHMALGLTPHLIFRNFGIGLGAQMRGNFVFHRYPSIEIDMGPELILPVAMAFNFLEDRLSVGFGLKFRVSGGINSDFGIEDIQALSSSGDDNTLEDNDTPQLEDYVKGGYGAGADLGILFTPIKTMEPTLGISITDFGGTSFTKFDVSGEAIGTPDIVLPSVNIGLSAKPVQTNATYVLATVDFHAVNQPVSFSKKFNLGIEWGWTDLIKVQGGLHQGYLTAGFQFDVGLLNVMFATYGEELGPTAGSIEDRRFLLQFKLLI
jgi:hypothetical protein